MEDYQLLIDLHKSAIRQGPGSDAETEMAIDMSMIDRSEPLKIADIGWGLQHCCSFDPCGFRFVI